MPRKRKNVIPSLPAFRVKEEQVRAFWTQYVGTHTYDEMSVGAAFVKYFKLVHYAVDDPTTLWISNLSKADGREATMMMEQLWKVS